MSSKLNSGVRYVYMYAWWRRLGMLTDKGRYSVVSYLQITLCDPYLIALEAFAETRYTNRR